MDKLKSKLNDLDDRAFDLVRRHMFITSDMSADRVSIEFSDDEQRRWRDYDLVGHNDAVARAEIFFVQVNAGMKLEIRC